MRETLGNVLSILNALRISLRKLHVFSRCSIQDAQREHLETTHSSAHSEPLATSTNRLPFSPQRDRFSLLLSAA
jgi:hypothetical protein